MTIEERNSIKAHLNELCKWVDEQAYSQSENEAAAETIESLENEVLEVREQRDAALERLDAMEAKVAMLIEYLQTMQRYHRSAGAYFMEQGDTDKEEKHGEAFVECVSADVMCMKLFDEDESEYVSNRIRMYADLAKSYESRFKV